MASKGKFGKDTEFSDDAKGLAGVAEDELWMDIQRRRLIAQEYLTYVGEAKEWIEVCLHEELPPITEFEEHLRNGVYLAKLGRFFKPEVVKKIFDEKQVEPLKFKHSDNFNAFIDACTSVSLPKIFYFELTDLYDRKNMPKVIYMVHALSLYLVKLGLAPKLQKKKYKFTDEELAIASEKLGDIVLPSFGDLAAQLDKETGGSKQSEVEKLQIAYEAKASPLSNWIEEQINILQNREFSNSSLEEVDQLLHQLKEFAEQKPPRFEEIQSLEADFSKISNLLAEQKKDPYQPPEWMRVETLRKDWDTMESEEKKRELELNLRRELALLEARGNSLKTWIREQTQFFAKRNYDEAGTEELRELGAKFQLFRENDKKAKQLEVDSFLEALKTFEEKCSSGNSIFLPAAHRQKEEVERIWNELEVNETRREKDIHFRIEMINLKNEYNDKAKGLSSWILQKIGTLEEKDFEGKNSEGLGQLRESLQKYKTEEKPPKAESYQQLKQGFQNINARLLGNEYSEFEPPEGLAIEDIDALWTQLEKVEENRSELLRTKQDLAVLEEAYLKKSGELVEWIKAQIEKNNQRNFPKSSTDCLKLAADEEHFKKTEKVRKAEIKDELASEVLAIQAKIRKEAHPDFKIPEDQQTAGIAALWLQLEKAEGERASALAAEQVRLGDEERTKLLHDHEEFWIKIQAIVRGNEARRKLRELFDYYKQREDKIIKIQALWRAKTAGEHYLALQKDSPPVTTIQKFLHLLDDSDRDFDEELELEKLKQQVVVQIRDNNEREKAINQLDIKIALLIKNRTTLDDVVESTKKYLKRQKKEPENHEVGLKSLDKEARQKLESYQHLFYLLQTEPNYLAALIFQLKKKDRIQKFIETVVLTLYGYAQNDREEYLLLKLFQHAIQLEMSQVEEPQDILRGNPVFIKLVVQYTRGAKERQFLRELLQPLVKDILQQNELDLDVDPLSIYRNMIKEEESRTGEKSSLAYDVSRSQALENDKVMKIFVKRLKDLRSITDKFLTAIIAALPKLPFGLRYIASQMRAQLEAKFPNDGEKITKIIGNLVYYRYMNPAIVAPEGFDVIETLIGPLQRKNLGEISKMLQQISVGKNFEDEFFYLSALNDFINKAKNRFYKYFNDAAVVMSPEEFFKIDKYDDFSKTKQPVIYISQEEIFSVHALLLENLDEVCHQEKQSPLRDILKEIPNPPEGAAESTHRGTEISLTLTNKYARVEAEDTAIKTLYVQTKRMILSVIRVQQGANLLEILQKPVTPNDEKTYSLQLEKEATQTKEREAKSAPSKSVSKSELSSELTLESLKKKVLENLVQLSDKKVISADNNYQEMLNAVAKDIKNKNRRRIQRKQELEKIRKTLKNLGEKTEYLEGQIKSYQEYVDACVAAMSENRSTKKGKKKTVVFSSQYFHEQKLKKEGKEYKFGSFKYTADKLFEKGVLVDLVGVPPSQRNKVSITISSDEVGVFEVQGTFLGVRVDAMELRLDDLLQKQFDNVQVMTLFSSAKVNVNLLIFLLNKKFYQ